MKRRGGFAVKARCLKEGEGRMNCASFKSREVGRRRITKKKKDRKQS